MKKFKFALLTFMTALISLGFTACSDDDDLKNVSVTGVTITPTTLTLKTGTTGTLTATSFLKMQLLQLSLGAVRTRISLQ